MNPWGKVTPKNSTPRLIHECVERNHYMAKTTPADFRIRDSVTTADCEIFTQGQNVSPSLNAFRKNGQSYKVRGFSELLKFWQVGNDLVPLLVSKTTTGFYNTIV